MKEEPHHPWIEPELEARIVALVLGEASDFERDELGRLIEERLELAMLKKRIEAMHGLLRDVATGEPVAADDDWKLSAEKRSVVLAVIGGEAKENPAKKVVNESVEKRKSVNGNFFWNFSKIAAVLCVMGFIAIMVMPAFTGSKEYARMSQLASREANTPESEVYFESFSGDESVPAVESFIVDDAQIAMDTSVVKSDYKKNSKSALSAIRGSLDSYKYYTIRGPRDHLAAAAASTKGVNGLESTSRQPADTPVLNARGLGRNLSTPSTAAVDISGLLSDGRAEKDLNSLALLGKDEGDKIVDRDGNGNGPPVSQPAIPKSGYDVLAFPAFAESSDDQIASEAAEPVESGATLGRAFRHYTESDSGDGQSRANRLGAVTGDRPAIERKLEHSGSRSKAALDEKNNSSAENRRLLLEQQMAQTSRPSNGLGLKQLEDGVMTFNDRDSAHGTELARSQAPQSEDTGSEFSNGLGDARTAVKDKPVDSIVAGDKLESLGYVGVNGDAGNGRDGFGGGGSGGSGGSVFAGNGGARFGDARGRGGVIKAEQDRGEIRAENKPEQMAERWQALLDTDEGGGIGTTYTLRC